MVFSAGLNKSGWPAAQVFRCKVVGIGHRSGLVLFRLARTCLKQCNIGTFTHYSITCIHAIGGIFRTPGGKKPEGFVLDKLCIRNSYKRINYRNAGLTN